MIYQWTDADFLKAFHFNGATLDPVPYAKGNVGSHGSPGGSLTISSDQKKPGTGIVWATLRSIFVTCAAAHLERKMMPQRTPGG